MGSESKRAEMTEPTEHTVPLRQRIRRGTLVSLTDPQLVSLVSRSDLDDELRIKIERAQRRLLFATEIAPADRELPFSARASRPKNPQ